MQIISFINNEMELNKVLPVIVIPFQDESIFGYILRLDKINNLPSGTILNSIKKHNTGVKSLNRPGLYVTAAILNLTILSEITNLPINLLEQLTYLPLIKRIFNSTTSEARLIKVSNNFKVCPICIKEMKLPLIHTIKDISFCLEHKLALHEMCICGAKFELFDGGSNFFRCNSCGLVYSELEQLTTDINDQRYKREMFYYKSFSEILFNDVNFIENEESYTKGYEDRFHCIIYNQGLSHSNFKEMFGYDVALIKNGHGLDNVSINKLLDVLYKLEYTPSDFQNLHPYYSAAKTEVCASINSINIETCPNIYCKSYNQNTDNVKYYGQRKNSRGIRSIELYCNECGTRFIENNIIQSYDYNPGLRIYDIIKANKRIQDWQTKLRNTCLEMIEKNIPITLTGSFKKSGIPIGKTYFVKKLGLVDILLEYTDMQRKSIYNNDKLDNDEKRQLIHRIYKKKST